MVVTQQVVLTILPVLRQIQVKDEKISSHYSWMKCQRFARDEPVARYGYLDLAACYMSRQDRDGLLARWIQAIHIGKSRNYCLELRPDQLAKKSTVQSQADNPEFGCN